MKGNFGKGLNPIETTSLLSMIGRYIGLVTPQLYLLLVFSLWLAQQAWQKNFETLTTIEAQQSQQRQIDLRKPRLDELQIRALLDRLKRMGSPATVTLKSRPDGPAIEITVAKPVELDAFRELLNVIISSSEGTIWNVHELCFGKCEGVAAKAVLSGFKQNIEVK